MKSHAMKARAEAEAQAQLQHKQQQQQQQAAMHMSQQSPLQMALGAAVRLQQQQQQQQQSKFTINCLYSLISRQSLLASSTTPTRRIHRRAFSKRISLSIGFPFPSRPTKPTTASGISSSLRWSQPFHIYSHNRNQQ